MELILKRLYDNHDSTVGHLYINGEPYCMTLEDTYRHEKIDRKTRIPAGRYEIKLRKGSPLAKRYEKKHGTEGMIWLQDVPNYQYVYMHIGNTERDTEGCILVAESIRQSVASNKIAQSIGNSTPIFKKLHKDVIAALNSGNQVNITVMDP